MLAIPGVRAAARTGVRAGYLDCSRHSLVGVPPLHAAHPMGYAADVDHWPGAQFCCAADEKHVAWHHRAQLREPGFYSNPRERRQELASRFAS